MKNVIVAGIYDG